MTFVKLSVPVAILCSMHAHWGKNVSYFRISPCCNVAAAKPSQADKTNTHCWPRESPVGIILAFWKVTKCFF